MSMKTSTSCHTMRLLNLPDGYSHTSTFTTKTWSGESFFGMGAHIWTDGVNIYYSNRDEHYVLDGDAWKPKVWHGLSIIRGGDYIWTDGDDIYYSYYVHMGSDENSYQESYRLNRGTSTWEPMNWELTNAYGHLIWTDGVNIFLSQGPRSYIFDKGTKSWSSVDVPISGLVYGDSFWSDGVNIYYSHNDQTQFVLVGDTWVEKTWNIVIKGSYIWTDGTHIYYTHNYYDENLMDTVYTNYVLNKDTGEWVEKQWYGVTDFYDSNLWTDGTNVYKSDGGGTHVLLPTTASLYVCQRYGNWSKLCPVP